jgi:hypothetical protein
MLEIRGTEISELKDEDLWALVGRLCEAELHSKGLPTAEVTWGGDPNAGDGGIDVRVNLSTSFDTNDFIPRNKTGFQVKKPDMPRSAILEEMRPNGKLRPAIIELAQARGAYIIVSGKSSLTDIKLRRRKEAMLEAVSDLKQANKLKLDYYDADRVATWVRSHPALILWVRSKIGKPVQGWLPYQNWANPKAGIDEAYILDEKLRLYDTANSSAIRRSPVEGIQVIRRKLHAPSAVVRFVGLSGVGKTRFIQALFDERIAENALAKSQVCYSDIGLSPIPEPVNFAQQLVSFSKPIILIVDNCPPKLHRALTDVCSAPGSLVRLLTVEYDVQEDLPEETEVYHLAPASDRFIEELIRRRLAHISRMDAETIANLSGGNARLALALADKVRPGENISHLKDEELFKRLFEQRHGPDQSLLRTAEACSLVYSFDSRTTTGEDLEMSLLSRLAEKTVGAFHRDITVIEDRQLIQRRNYWKALLPHALANKLAETALKRFLLQDLIEAFELGGSERLLQSFSKRLSYLHESEIARSIARRWLAPDGLLGNLLHLDRIGMNVLTNIAPIEPDAVLSAIDRAKNLDQEGNFLSAKHIFADDLSRLLWALAYDSSRFDKATDLLCHMALTESRNETNKQITYLLSSLFQVQLSGTHAPVEQRLQVIQQLINTGAENRQQLGLSLLTAALKASNLHPVHNFNFGAHSRDYGARNDTKEAIHLWYGTVLDYSLMLLQSRPKLAQEVMIILSDSMQGLWNNAKVHDKTEEITHHILQLGAWNEGWLAVRETLRTVGKNMPPEVVARLQKLEVDLQPKTLIDRARAYALTAGRLIYALYEEEEDTNVRTDVRHDKLKETTREIGREVAGDQDVLTALLPELLSQQGVGLFELGQGLAAGTTDPRSMWEDFCGQLVLTEPRTRNFQLLGGFLNKLWDSNEALVEQLLDEAVDHDLLSEEYPYFQTRITINHRGIERLKRSINLGLAPISNYAYIGYGGAYEPISDAALLTLLKLISEKPGGNAVAIGILQMRMYNFIHNKKQVREELFSGARQLLINYQFSENDRYHQRLDHELAEIFATSFSTNETQQVAEQFGDNFVNALEKGVINYFHFQELINAFAKHQPQAFLQTFVKEHLLKRNIIDREFFNGSGSSARATPAEEIAEETLLSWCDIDPMIRYPIIAQLILPYQEIDPQTYRWNPVALRILESTSDTENILAIFAAAFDPGSWFGSLLSHFIKGVAVIAEFKDHSNPVITDWAAALSVYLSERIEEQQEWEDRRGRSRQEGFE